MLFLSKEDTKKLVDIRTAVEKVLDVAKWENNGLITTPDPPVSVMITANPKSRYRTKMAYISEIPIVGIRIIGYPLGSSYKESTRFVLLSDPATGEPLALVDDHWNYILRTVASAVMGLTYVLGPDSPLKVGLVGAGNLAGAMLEASLIFFNIAEVVVTSRREISRSTFAEKMKEKIGLNIRAADNVETAVSNADLVITATNAGKRLVKSEWLKKGVTVCALGHYEIDEQGYDIMDKIIVDSWGVTRTAKDVKEMMTKGVLSQDHIYAEFYQLVNGTKKGRTKMDERILIRTDGLVSQDVCIAYYTYQEALKQGIGKELI